MIDQTQFFEKLYELGVDFFTGVPDSFLNGFCDHLIQTVSTDRHVIAANEGNAIAIASGYYFATGKLPLVYMQNSGLGNALNPLVSLVDNNVYQVPLLLLVGWRGEPGTELKHPQHKMQGNITLKIMEMLNIPYFIAEDDIEKLKAQIEIAVAKAKENKIPVAIVGRKGVFAREKKKIRMSGKYPMSRREAIEVLLDTLPQNTIYVATTGRATRELYFLREERMEGHQRDFLNLGAMGHASSVALGIALAKRDTRVVCLDGDSAAIMHMGSFTTVGKLKIPNLMHVVLNNGAHESVGGQPSAGDTANFTKIAENSGYQTIGKAVTYKEEFIDAIQKLENEKEPVFIDVKIDNGLKKDLPPLDISTEKLIYDFMSELHNTNER